jgi:spore maturation protein CgeB
MKLGFYIKWDKFSIESKGNVIGDELWAESLCKSINKQYSNIQVELYAPNYLPQEQLDVMIYLNDVEPIATLAKCHILYLQNGYGYEAEKIIAELVKNSYDGYVFFAKKMKEIYDSNYGGVKSLFLPFGVDTDIFYPREIKDTLAFECAYIGNDIKGEEATMKYLYPATNFNFGLFGNWKIPKSRFRFWKNFAPKPIYKKKFEKISQGKIAQEDVPILYSSTKINLNCTLQDCIDWNVITLRTYEVLACKGFLITDIVPVAQETMNGCMVFTTGLDDLIEKIKYYLEHDEERTQIAQNGYDYVMKYASIDARSQELIQYIKGLIK